ncbi:MAG TPA: HAD-IIB family hydrolase [Clostridiaceae bacterium]|nr:HAD-IIB family hydrolase [Clostridiaceae bacterium]
MKKIFYFDIDGTLFDIYRNYSVSEKTRNSIAKIQKNGNLAVINTGRSLACIPQEILDLNFDGIIAGCGTYVEIKDQILHNQLLDEELINRIIEIFSREETDLLMEGPNYIYTLDTIFDQDIARRALNLFNLAGRRRNIHEIPLHINKISYLIKDPQSDQSIIQTLQDELDFIIYPSELREGLPPGSSKKTGMVLLEQWLQNKAKITIDETYAFGDSLNDKEMLEHATYGIAMGNADPNILHLTDFITLDVIDDGIEHALLHFNLL